MNTAAKFTITLVLFLVLGGLAVTDYLFADGRFAAEVTSDNSQNDHLQVDAVNTAVPNLAVFDDTTENEEEIPEGAVAKNQGISVQKAAEQGGFTLQETEELTLLSQIIPTDITIQSAILLRDGDRTGSVAWVESPKVKTLFATLKDALITSFSPQVQDLRDETMQQTGAPVRNILTFLDPALSEERIIFIRVRERLFEFHITAGNEAIMQTFIEQMTSQ